MSGFSAISAGNGWMIAALGISVVFFGLASLAFIISYSPRTIDWWNTNVQTPRRIVPLIKGLFRRQEEMAATPQAKVESHEPGELGDAEEALRLITAHMGEPFKLPRLIEVAEQRGLARVYSTISHMLVGGTMVGGIDGLFRWAEASDEETRSQTK